MVNSSFDTTVARRQLRHFRTLLGLGKPARTSTRSGSSEDLNPNLWGLLKQPDNQLTPSSWHLRASHLFENWILVNDCASSAAA